LRSPIQRGFEPSNANPFNRKRLSLEEPLKKSPNDPTLLSQKYQDDWKISRGETQDQFFREYDALIAKNPERLDLWRNRLRLSTSGPLLNEPNTLKYSRLEAERKKIPFRDKPNQLWMDPKQLKLLVKQARSAQKLAPEEGFFPFIESMASLGLGREEEGFEALERAGKCSAINDGAMDEIRAILAVWEKQHAQDWDEKLLVSWTMLFPHMSGMRSAVREMVYSGIDQYQKGNKAAAWRRWKAALAVGHRLRLSNLQGPDATYIGRLVGESMEMLVWEAIAKTLRPDEVAKRMKGVRLISPREKTDLLTKNNAQIFESFALQNGQRELALWSHREYQTIAEQKRSNFEVWDSDPFARILGYKTPIAVATVQVRWFGAHAFWLACCGVLGYVVSLLATRGGKDPWAARSTVWNLSAFFLMLWIGLVAWAVVGGVGLDSYLTLLSLQSDDSHSPNWPLANANANENFWWFLFFTALATMLLNAWGNYRRRYRAGERKKSTFPFAQLSLAILWISVLFLTSLIWGDWFSFHETSEFSPFSASLLGLWLLTIVAVLLLTWRTQKSVAPGQSTLMKYAWGTAAWLLISVVLTSQSNEFFKFYGALAGLAGVLWVLFNLREIFRNRILFSVHLRIGLEVCGRVLANLALGLSLLYFLVSVALLPAHNQMNQKVDNYLQMGEVDWLKAQK
jgi:hypothetical protein